MTGKDVKAKAGVAEVRAKAKGADATQTHPASRRLVDRDAVLASMGLEAKDTVAKPKQDRGGLTRDEIVARAAEWRGDWPPTQDNIAEVLKRDPSRIRQVQGPGGWAGIIKDARRRR